MTTYWEQHFEQGLRQNLKPEYASNRAIVPPYKWAHLSPAAIDGAIGTIRARAAPGPRRFYDMGQSDDVRVNNWVLKWLLWHVCRYRDWRNRKHRHAGTEQVMSPPLGAASGGSAMASAYAAPQAGGSALQTSSKPLLSRAVVPRGSRPVEQIRELRPADSGLRPDYPSVPPHDYWSTVLNP